MKKITLLLIFVLFIGFQSLFAWGWAVRDAVRQTSENPTFYLGDQVSFAWDVNSTSWGAVLKKAGIGTTNSSAGMNWQNIIWVDDAGDGNGNNEGIRSSTFTVSSTGTWYYSLWIGFNNTFVGDNGTWSDGNSAWAEGNTSFESSSFTVTALSDPTSLVASAASNTQINLSWAKWNSKNVMVVRRLTSAAASNAPTQGSAYTVGNTLGTGTVVYNGSGTSFNDTGLTPGTNYTYIFYSENYSYYSPGSTATATTTAVSSTSDYFRSKANGNWNTIGSWESSDNGSSNWITATLVPGSSALGITILNGHNITLDANVTVSSLTINSGATFTASDATARILTISKSTSGSSTTLSNSGTWANGTGGSTVVFSGSPSSGDAIHASTGTIAFQNITVSKTSGTSNVGASFGVNASVSGTLEIGSGGFVSTAPPTSFYGANAILKFNQGSGATYNVGAGDYSWSTTVIPNYITISSGTVNLNADRTATGNLLIDGGALTLGNSANLTIQGNWTRSSGSFTSNSGTVTLSGTSNGTIDITGGGAMTNLIVGKTGGAKVILNSSLTTTNTTINAGSKLDINNGVTLTATTLNLKSNNTDGTATLVNNGTITATTTNVEQYIPSARNWYITSPLSSASSPVSNITRYYEYVEPGNNGDMSVTGSTAYWKGYNTGHSMVAGKGYIAQVSAANTFTMTGGNLNNGNVSTPTLTRTGAANKPGYNLIGNPYPSYLDMDGFSASSFIFPTYWIRSYNSNYVFDTYNITSALSTGPSGKSVTRYIPPMQAFWVKLKTDQTSGTIQFTNAMRAHKDATNNVYRAPAVTKSPIENKILRLQVQSKSNIDEALIYFNANASDNFDGYDSQKWFNLVDTIPEIYSVVDSEKLVINGFNSVQLNTEIPLGFRTGINDLSHTYKFKATEFQNFDSTTELVLIDKDQSNAETILNEGSEYTFNSAAVNSTSRFSLVFRTKGTVTGGCCFGTFENKIRIQKNENNQLVVNCDNLALKNTNVTVYNAAGQKLFEQGIYSSNTVINSAFKAGVYLVKLQSEGKTYDVKVVI